MKAIKQLLRQPIKAAAGILLVTIAVAALCVCAGQSMAARETEERLDQSYLTLAFPKSDTDGIQSQWLDSYAGEHPEVVKEVSRVGLASAYIPELTIDNWTQHWHKPLVTTPNLFTPYDTAILEITLTRIGEVMPFQNYAKDWAGNYITDENGQLMPLEYPGENVVVNLTGTIERVIALEEGYPDPVSFTARLTLSMPNRETLEALNLTVGERYLVYGTDYTDQDWELRHRVASIMAWNKDTKLPDWDLDTFEGIYDYHSYEVDGITYFSYWTHDEEGQPEEIVTVDDLADVPATGFKCKIGDLHHGMTLRELNQFRSVSMVCSNDGVMPKSRIYQTEDGNWACEMITERSYLNENGQEVSVSQEEYAQRYREPTIVHLTGTAEEFLASEEGALWTEALYNVEINNHAFAFLGVDAVGYIENFDCGEARIIQGRDFTDEELETGTKVCIISKQLAETNGLSVGDTINPQFYDPDRGLNYQLSMDDNGLLPKPLYYFSNTTRLQPAQSYTIVGIYEQNDPTPSLFDQYGQQVNPYGFTSNSIFAPKISMDAAMHNRESGLFKTAVLQNGALEDFQLAAIEAGLGEEFQYTDNGYSAVEGSLTTYRENAARALAVGMAVYGILLLLFLMLFPAREGTVLQTMEALGAERSRRIGYMLSSALGLLIPGTVIGTGCGMLLWDGVAATLSENGTTMLDIRMNTGSMTAVAVMQLVTVLVLVLVMAVHMTKNRNLSKRK